MALATTFSANEPWFGRFVLVGTFWILPLAYFIRNIPLVAQAAIASFRQYDPALEEAAHSLGASALTTMRRVAAPLVLPGLAAGGLLAFVAALGEFVSSILLYTYRSRPISIEILSQLRSFDFGVAAALGVVLAALMTVVFAFGGSGADRTAASGPTWIPSSSSIWRGTCSAASGPAPWPGPTGCTWTGTGTSGSPTPWASASSLPDGGTSS
jgi:iron(III) transport system permease protein